MYLRRMYIPLLLGSVQFSSVTQLCLTLCNTTDCILQARILEWVAFPFSRGLANPGIEPRSSALMLKLKLQYFGHLMQRADSFVKTLMLGKIEGRRRRG